jgi:hypothetical protein
MTNLDLFCVSRDTILFTMIFCMIYNLYSFVLPLSVRLTVNPIM